MPSNLLISVSGSLDINPVVTPYKKPDILKDGKNMLFVAAFGAGAAAIVLSLIGRNIIHIPYTHELSRNIIFGIGIGLGATSLGLLGVRIFCFKRNKDLPDQWKGVRPDNLNLQVRHGQRNGGYYYHFSGIDDGNLRIYKEDPSSKEQTELLNMPFTFQDSRIVIDNIAFDDLYDIAEHFLK